MQVIPASGVLNGVPRKGADMIQEKGAATPGLFDVKICSGAVCKPTEIAVFSNFSGTWDGTYSGDPGAFACNTPLSGEHQARLEAGSIDREGHADLDDHGQLLADGSAAAEQ
jgi:hypothetical protein